MIRLRDRIEVYRTRAFDEYRLGLRWNAYRHLLIVDFVWFYILVDLDPSGGR